MNRMLSLALFVMLTGIASAQQVFLENFETTSSFTLVNASTNSFVQNTASAYSGTYSLYITDYPSATTPTCTYTKTMPAVSHAYRDVTFPTAPNDRFILKFYWRAGGESTYDGLKVFVVPTSTTPFANTLLTSGQVGLTWYNLDSTWKQATIALDPSFAGTTQRIVFSWRNYGSGGINPSGGLDDIELDAYLRSPLSGTYTIDPLGSGPTNFTTFQEAIDSLHANGISSSVTFNVAAGSTFNENLTAITATGTSTNRIIFQKSGAGANPIIKPSGTSAGTKDYGVCISGGDFITFDGIDIQTASATGNFWVEYGYLIRNGSEANGAKNNVIKNCTITLSKTNTSSWGVTVSANASIGGGVAATDTAGTNSWNRLENISINNAYCGIRIYGTSDTYMDMNNVIKSCTIGQSTVDSIGFGSSLVYGIYTFYQRNLSILNNEIQHLASTWADIYGVYANRTGYNYAGTSNFIGNKIHDLKSRHSYSSAEVYGLYVSNGSWYATPVNNIFNNAIYGNRSSGAVQTAYIYNYGMYLYYGTNRIFNNTVRMDDSSKHGSCAIYLSSDGYDTLRNNILANYAPGVADSLTAPKYLVYGGGAILAASNNLYYMPLSPTDTAYYIGQAGEAYFYRRFQKWPAALSYWASDTTTGLDAGSGVGDPNFITGTYTFAGSTPARQSGTPVYDLDTDINGTVRNTTAPCIGAIEETTQLLNDKTPPVLSNIVVTSGVSPSVSIYLKDNSASGTPANVYLWYRLGQSGAYTGVAADVNPGVMNGTYAWNTSLSALAKGVYYFYITARDGAGPGQNITVYPIHSTDWNAWSASDPPNFAVNPDAAAKKCTFKKDAVFAAGTYTIGAGGTYATLKALADSLSNTIHTASSIFEFIDTYAGETQSADFINIAGTSPTVTLTIRPSALNALNTVSSFSSGSYSSIKLINSSYITFDGRKGGTGSTIAWTIRNTGTLSPGSTVQISGGSSYNSLAYITIEGQADKTTGVVQIGIAGTTGNSYNTVTNCVIRDLSTGGAQQPGAAVYALGTSGLENKYNVFSNNRIFNFWNSYSSSYGMCISSYNSDWTISNNHFYQEATRTATAGTTHYGIYINASTAVNMTITGNYIGGSAPSCGGTPWTVRGDYENQFSAIYVSSSSTAGLTGPASIQGNTIANFDWWTSSSTTNCPGVWNGIYIGGGNANIGTVTGNTIGAATGTQSIKVCSTKSSGVQSGIAVAWYSSIQSIQNNTIGSLELRGYTTSTPITHSISFRGIWIGSSAHTKIINNTVGSATTAKSISLNDSTASNDSTGQDWYGIHVSSTTTDTVSNNLVANVYNNYQYTAGTVSGNSNAGIYVSDGTATVTDNTVRDLSTTSPSYSSQGGACMIGIYVYNTSYVHTVARNNIYGLSNIGSVPGTSMIGLYYGGSTSGTAVIERNNIHSLGLSSANANSQLVGMRVQRGSATIKNNMIRVGFDAAGNAVSGASIFGIKDTSTSGASSYCFNSVYTGGTDTVSCTTYAFASYAATTTRLYENNIFFNGRSGGQLSKHYAYRVGGTGTSPTGLTSNYNLIYANGTSGVLGYYDGADRTSLSAWKSATGKDSNSRFSDPQFINPTGNATTGDLHIQPSPAQTPIESAGSAITGIDNDYDNDIRSGLTPTDIGADAGDFERMFDTDSKADDPSAGQVAGGTIASTVTTPGAAIEMFRFCIEDVGTSDGMDTKVTTIKISNANPTSAASWANDIAGIRLAVYGGSDITTGTPTITNSEITIPITSGNLVIPDSGRADFSLFVYLKTTGTVEDGKVFQFTIPQTNHGWEADTVGRSSAFAGDFGKAVTGNSFTIDVDATRLAITTPTTCIRDSAFSATVQAVDENNNIDVDDVSSVTLAGNTGSGTLTSTSGLTKSLSGGHYQWTDLEYDAFGYFTIQTTTAGLTADTSSIIDCQARSSAAFTIGTGTSTSTYTPLSTTYGYSRSVALYTQALLGSYPTIIKLGWYVSSSIGDTLFPVKIYLKDTSATTISTATTWTKITSGATLVYDGIVQFNSTGWKTFSLTTPFTHTSGSLLVLVEGNIGGGGANNSASFRYTSTTSCAQYIRADNSPPTGTMTASSYKPNIQITPEPLDAMEYVRTEIAQDTSWVDAGSSSNKITRVNVYTQGGLTPVSLEKLRVNLTGTSNIPSDVDSVKVYYTGSSSTFSTATSFGLPVGGTSLTSSFDVGGASSQTLLEGNNYFWIAANIKSTAAGSDTVRVNCDSILVAAVNHAPEIIVSPTGMRNSNTIVNKTLTSIVVTQASTAGVVATQKNRHVLKLAFTVAGPATGSLLLNSVTVNSANQNDADIDSVKAFQTGTTNSFLANNQIGTNQVLTTGAATLGSLTYNLPTGTGYVWLTYNIAAGATAGDSVDMKIPINGITVGSTTYNAVEENPFGHRTVRGPMSGSYTVGASGANYQTLSELFADMNVTGVSGAVTVLINGDYSSATDIFPIVIDSIPNISATWPVTLKPNTGVSAGISGSSTSSIFRFNGTDYFTIDGSNAGTTSRNLTIENTSTGTSSAVVWFSSPAGVNNGCSNNTVKNTIISGNAKTTTLAGIISSGTSISATNYPANPNSFNTYQNNLLEKCQHGMALNGSTVDLLDSNTVIKDNTFGTSTAAEGFNLTAINVKRQASITINNNDIQNVLGSPSSSLIGISMTDTRGSLVKKNKIHYMQYTGSSTYYVYGVYTQSSTYTTSSNPSNNVFVNNMLYDLQNGGTGSTWAVSGLTDIGGYGDTFYYNSVYLSGTLNGGTGPSAAFANGTGVVSTCSNPIDVRNNIFAVNGTTGSSVSSLYAHYTRLTSMAASTIDYNDLYSAVSSGSAVAYTGYFSSARSTLSDWRAATGVDANSISVLPLFTSTTNLHMNAGTTPTQIESSGRIISGYTTDIDGDTRPGPAGSVNGGASAPDMGADEFDGVPLDGQPPVITYTPLSGTTSQSNRTLSNVSIYDLRSGADTLATTRPRIYYKRLSDANDATGWKYTEATGTGGTPFSFTIDYSLLNGGVVNAYDTVQYFIVAQDKATTPNVGINSGAFAATPASVALTSAQFPISGTINRYKICPGYNDTLTVGTGGRWASLKDAFNNINRGLIIGNVTIRILSDLTEATMPVLNTYDTDNPDAGYTITINPVGARTVQCADTAVVKLFDADRVIIDGLNASGNSLTFINTGTTSSRPVIWVGGNGYGAGADSVVIRNCTLQGNSALMLTTSYGIFSGNGTSIVSGSKNDSLIIEGNKINLVYQGICIYGSSSYALHDYVRVLNNEIGDTAATNSLYYQGVRMQYVDHGLISGNEILGIKQLSATIAGVYLSNAVYRTTVEKNNIHALQYTGNSGCGPKGICASGTSGGNIRIVNNLIYDIIGDGETSITGSSACAIYLDGTLNSIDVWYNSVNMYGTQTQTIGTPTAPLITACMYIGSSCTVLDIRNNSFANAITQVSSTYNNYGIYSAAANTAFLDIDNNCYHMPDTTGRIGYLGGWFATITDWRTATGKDLHSVTGDPKFTSTTDLTIATGSGTDAIPSGSDLGTPIAGVPNDYTNTARNASHPDAGAYEFDVIRSVTGTGPFTMPTGRVDNLTFNATGQTMMLGGDLSVYGTLTLTGGLMTLGDYNLTLGASATIGGTPSATNMVVPTSTGQMRKTYTATGSFTYPVGDNTGTAEYSPITLNFTTGTFGATPYAGVSLVNAKHPGNPSLDNYLARYWTVGSNDITAFTCNVTGTYVPADITGYGSFMYTGKWNGTSWAKFAAADTTNNQIAATGVTSFSDFSGGEGVLMDGTKLIVRAKVFLQGAWDYVSAMTTYLNATDIPLTQPYASPWQYAYTWSYAGTESVTAIPGADITDWVLLELRTTTDASSMVERRAAFLKSDGSIVDLDGRSPVSFHTASINSYYLVVYHRNHIAIMTALTQPMSMTTSLYDFSTAQNKGYGFATADPMFDLSGVGTGPYAMIAGDVDPDGYVVYAAEESAAWNDSNTYLTEGYYQADFDMDGYVVYSSEESIIWNNDGKYTQVP